jgi:DNA-binding IclR family transcriptional regulator
MSAPPHHVKSDVTAFRIVTALDRWGEMGVTEIAQETGIGKSSVHKHLTTLRHLGFVTKSGSTYALSLRWFRAGKRVRERRAVFRAARGELDRLAERIGETVSLVVEEDGSAVYVHQSSEREPPVAPIGEGGRIPAPLSVGGKAILSYRPVEEVESLLDDIDLEGNAEQLFSELRTLRNQRMVIERDSPNQGAFSAGAFEGHRHVVGHGEPYRNIHSVAVPVRDVDDYAVGAVEVSGSESSLYGRRLEEEIASLLVNTGKSIETRLIRDDD